VLEQRIYPQRIDLARYRRPLSKRAADPATQSLTALIKTAHYGRFRLVKQAFGSRRHQSSDSSSASGYSTPSPAAAPTGAAASSQAQYANQQTGSAPPGLQYTPQQPSYTPQYTPQQQPSYTPQQPSYTPQYTPQQQAYPSPSATSGSWEQQFSQLAQSIDPQAWQTLTGGAGTPAAQVAEYDQQYANPYAKQESYFVTAPQWSSPLQATAAGTTPTGAPAVDQPVAYTAGGRPIYRGEQDFYDNLDTARSVVALPAIAGMFGTQPPPSTNPSWWQRAMRTVGLGSAQPAAAAAEAANAANQSSWWRRGLGHVGQLANRAFVALDGAEAVGRIAGNWERDGWGALYTGMRDMGMDRMHANAEAIENGDLLTPATHILTSLRNPVQWAATAAAGAHLASEVPSGLRGFFTRWLPARFGYSVE